MSQRRRATHAGSWYSNRESELHQRMDGWLAAVKVEHGPAKAIISPHAGYEYCGSCAAYAYKQIDPSSIDRVFILGPSHHYALGGCALSVCDTYETPFYDLRIDQKMCAELAETGLFERMSIDVDEDEHSIEMQLPYLAKVMESRRNDPAFRIIPILVGSLSVAKEAEYGRALAKYLEAPRTLTIVSSDFCHWGSRFSYTHYRRECGEIFESITQLDRDAIDIIESLEPARFAAYLRETRNTICGRHPIGVLLNAIATLRNGKSGISNGHSNGTANGHTSTSNGNSHAHTYPAPGSLKFLHYSQSNRCMSMRDSSVSYAAASFLL